MKTLTAKHTLKNAEDRVISADPKDCPYWQERLSERGILNASLSAGWEGATDEWIYPIHNLNGEPVARRTKHYDGQATPKYRWLPAKPVGCDYYYPPANLHKAIAEDDGRIYIASGEVDLLTYVSAGIHNVIAWFGETNVPRNLAEHLQALNVQEVLYLPDKDDAGLKSAIKVRDRLLNTGISYSVRQLPDELPDKGDTNDLWCVVNFEAKAFRDVLEKAPPIELPEPREHNIMDAFMPNYEPSDNLLRWEDLSQEIERRLGIHHYNAEGWSHPIACLFKHHTHDDTRPASSWNHISHIFHCHKCGETWLAKDVAEKLGIDWKKHVTSQRKKRKNAPTKEQKERRIQDRIHPFTPDKLDADIHVNMPYISELALEEIPQSALLIRSAIGTGKTELVKKIIASEAQKRGYKPTVLVITHRQALAENIAQRLGMTCYKHVESEALRQTYQLVMVYNSLWRLSSSEDKIPQYDLIIIDEIEQFHEHLGGSTFTAGEAKRAYTILRELVKHSGRVIGLDAHATNISRAWLTHFCEKVTTIENDHIPDKGQLTLHARRETVIQRATRLADRDEGVVVLPTNSRSEAKRLERYFCQRYGHDAVRMISAENSESNSTQAFLRDINTHIQKLRIFIYSPSLGTGIDITAPVRGVCAIFKGNHLAAHELHQLMGRCRNVQETHAYVQIVEGNREENWQNIYQQHERNALRTGEICDFDEAGIYAVTPIQKSMLKLLAMLEARRNRSMNASLSAFVALGQSYHICYHNEQNDKLRQDLKKVSETIAEDAKKATLKAIPVDKQTLEEHRQAGTITPEIKAGYQRWLIEETVGEFINETLYEDLHHAKARERLRAFAELDTEEAILQKLDQDEARQEYLLSRRTHHTMRQQLLRQTIQQVWQCTSISKATNALTKDEIETRLQTFLDKHRADLTTYMGWRHDQSERPVAILRWMLSQIGVRLESQQIMRDGQRYRIYALSKEDIQRQQTYAESHRKHHQNSRQKRENGAHYSKHGL